MGRNVNLTIQVLHQNLPGEAICLHYPHLNFPNHDPVQTGFDQ